MHAQHYSDVVDKYLQYLNEKNPEGIVSLYADNATVQDPVGSDVIVGKDAIRTFYAKIGDIDMKVSPTGPVRIAGAEIAFPFQLFMNITGTSMKTDIIDVFLFDEDGKILSMRAFRGPENRTTS